MRQGSVYVSVHAVEVDTQSSHDSMGYFHTEFVAAHPVSNGARPLAPWQPNLQTNSAYGIK